MVWFISVCFLFNSNFFSFISLKELKHDNDAEHENKTK
jgi:hypothetical protein